MSFAAHFRFQPFGQCVDRFDPHSVQSAGADFVAPVPIEFSASMDVCQHNFQSGFIVFFGHWSHRNATSVIRNRHAAVSMDHDREMRGMPVRALVDAVIDQFVNQMMQSQSRRVANIHGRPMPNPLKALQGLKMFGTVLAVCG